MRAALLIALALLPACSLETVSAGGISGLECGRVLGDYVPPQAEGCYVKTGGEGCHVVPEGADQCGGEPELFRGGVGYEVWCDAWVTGGTVGFRKEVCP